MALVYCQELTRNNTSTGHGLHRHRERKGAEDETDSNVYYVCDCGQETWYSIFLTSTKQE